MNQFQQYFEARSFSDYVPERDDYLNWKDDWNKLSEYDDGTHSEFISHSKGKIWRNEQGLIHRDDDKPAIIYSDTEYGQVPSMYWYKNNLLFRDNDKPNTMFANGDNQWTINKKKSYNSTNIKNLLSNVQLHRANDRPARVLFVNKNNSILKRWYKKGQQYWPEEALIKAIQHDGLTNFSIEYYIAEINDPWALSKLINYIIDNNGNLSLRSIKDIADKKFEFKYHPKIIDEIKKIIYNDLSLLDQFKHIPEIKDEFYGHVKLGEVGL